jgi:hypothetical protein
MRRCIEAPFRACRAKRIQSTRSATSGLPCFITVVSKRSGSRYSSAVELQPVVRVDADLQRARQVGAIEARAHHPVLAPRGVVQLTQPCGWALALGTVLAALRAAGRVAGGRGHSGPGSAARPVSVTVTRFV